MNKQRLYSLCLLAAIALSILVAGCDSPSGSFERLNTSDPGSVVFDGEKEEDYSVQLELDSDRNITLVWGELEEFIDRVVVKKSLGDNQNYSTVANLETFGTQWQDTTGTIDRDIYYKIETFYTRNDVEYKYGETEVDEKLEGFLDFSFEINNQNESLDIKWEADNPFFNSFVLESDHIITESGEKRVEIPFSTLQNTISIKDPDITFSQRHFSLTGVIEGENGQDDIIIKRELEANLQSAYKPTNLSIEIIDEQDWLLSWDGAPYFAEKVKVIRNRYDNNRYIREFQPNKESLLDTVLSVSGIPLANGNRQYRLTFEDGNTASDTSYVDDWLDLTQPNLIETVAESPMNQSITIGWEITGTDVDKIKEFIIEKQFEGDFEEIGRVPADKRQFTFSGLDIAKQPTFRVRTLASSYSPPKSYHYVNNYSRVQSLNTHIGEYPTTQTTTDNQYFAWLPEEGGAIEIWDLNSGEQVNDFQSEMGPVSDFKISHDNQHIYYLIPERGSVFRADFPSWNNVTEVIDDAVFSNINFEMDGYPIQKIDVSSDGEFMLGVGLNYVKRWSLDNFELMYTKRYESIPNRYKFHIDISDDNETFLASGSATILLNKTGDGSTIRQYRADQYFTDLSFSPLNNFIHAESFNDTYIFRLDSDDIYKRLTGPSYVNFHPSNDKILLIVDAVRNNNDSYYNIYFYDLEEERRFGDISDSNLNRPENYLSHLEYVDSNRIIFGTSSHQGALEIWEKAESKQWKMIR